MSGKKEQILCRVSLKYCLFPKMSLTLSQAVSVLNAYPANLQTLSISLQQTQDQLNSQQSSLASMINSGAPVSTLQSKKALIASTTATLSSQQNSLKDLIASYKQAQTIVANNAVASATGPSGTAFQGSLITRPISPRPLRNL